MFPFDDVIMRNSYILIQENAFENIVSKMAAILSRPQCVNKYVKGYKVLLEICY